VTPMLVRCVGVPSEAHCGDGTRLICAPPVLFNSSMLVPDIRAKSAPVISDDSPRVVILATPRSAS
jgi:hypothetical protein